MAGREPGPGPRGEKHPGTALPSGGQAARAAPLCDACALCDTAGQQMRPNAPIPGSVLWPGHLTHNHQISTRLRVALVDSDERVHDFVRQAFEAHANGWTLYSHLTPHSALDALGSMSATPHSPRSEIPTSRDIPHSHVPPDVVLLEAQLPGPSGIDCARRLTGRLPDARIVMFTACSDHDTIVESVMAGALGYLIKPVAPGHLVWAVSEAAQGRRVLCEQAQAAVMHYVRRIGAACRCKTLSEREREIMLLLLSWASNGDIARRLFIDRGTVHWHLDNIFKKLHVHSRAEARRKFMGGGVNSCSPGGV